MKQAHAHKPWHENHYRFRFDDRKRKRRTSVNTKAGDPEKPRRSHNSFENKHNRFYAAVLQRAHQNRLCFCGNNFFFPNGRKKMKLQPLSEVILFSSTSPTQSFIQLHHFSFYFIFSFSFRRVISIPANAMRLPCRWQRCFQLDIFARDNTTLSMAG